MSERVAVERKSPTGALRGLAGLGRRIFLASGILPLVLIVAIVGFALAEPRFLTYQNLFNVARASSFLVIVSMGQMLTLLVRGVDMSIGSTEALVSVCVALVMATVLAFDPGAPWLAIAAGIAAGLAVGALVGAVNGIGVAIFNVSPFIMTVGMLSILSGVALTVSGGMPMYGMPKEFGEVFAYAAPFGIPAPVLFAAGVYAIIFYILNWTPFGRRIYAIGGNVVASRLAGISTRLHMVLTYVMCSTIVAFGGILLTARVGTGEATLASTHVLEFDHGRRHSRRFLLRRHWARGQRRAGSVFCHPHDQRHEFAARVELPAADRPGLSAHRRGRGRSVAHPDDAARPVGVEMSPVLSPSRPVSAHAPLLKASGIVKAFGGNRALNGVSLEVRDNEIMALVGDNGAGKSTLVKILSGAETPDEGTIHVGGVQAAIANPHDAHDLGIATLHQHLGLVDCFDVPQNVFLGRELYTRFLGVLPVLRQAEMAERTRLLLRELDIRLPYLDRPVSTMSGGQRQAVAISRLLLGDIKLIIMDEPMAALGVHEGQKVLELISRLSRRGISFLIVSHNMEHVMSISNRVAVLKNGNLVGVVPTEGTSRQDITSMIIHGRI